MEETRLLSFVVALPNENNYFFFFFNDTATTEIYTLSLHVALPISFGDESAFVNDADDVTELLDLAHHMGDRKSTRLNSSHSQISYAVFCLKKKKVPLHIPAVLLAS